jgi:hypothetical protein
MRLRLPIAFVALAGLATLLPCGFAEPRDGWNLAARVPASTIALAGFEDLHLAQQRFEATAIGRMAQDPSMKAFFEPLAEALEQMAGPDMLPPPVMDLLKQLEHLRGQLAVAFVGMDESKGEPLLVASLDFGQHVGDFAEFLQRMLAEVGGEDVKLEVGQQNGRPVWTIAIRGGPTLSATTVDTTFVVATHPTLLQDVAGAPAAAGTLATSADFLAVDKKLAADGLCFRVYANVPAALATFARGWDGEERQMADAMGLDTLRAAAYGMSFSGDGFRDSLVLHTPGADHGLMTLLTMPPLTNPRLLDLVPANAFACGEGNVDLSNLLPGVRKLMAQLEPRMASEMDEALSGMSRQVGVDLERDLLAGLAGSAAWYLGMPQGGGLFPELAVMLTVKDPAAYEKTLLKLWEGVAGMVNEEGDVLMRPRVLDVDGQRLHLIELQAARGDDVVPLTPSWTLLGDRLVITLVPYTLREIVWRAKNPTEAGGGIQSQEDFKALWNARPAAAGEFGYLDLQAILSLLYDTGVPLLQAAVKPNMLEKAGLPFTPDWALLPPARQVRKYFRSMAWTESFNRDGIEFTLHSPIPLMPIVLAAAAGAAVAMQMMRPPSMRDMDDMVEIEEMEVVAPEQAFTETRAQLEDLARYVKLYVLERGEMPATLADLVKAGMIDAVPVDAWGREVRLVVADASKRDFRVVSPGPDGKPDTSDDLAAAGR